MRFARDFALVAAIVALCASFFPSCTANQRAKNFGGTQTIDLDPDKKLVTVAWEDDHLWILTRDIHAGEKPETMRLEEKSSFGVLQGAIIIVEHSK